MDTWVEEIEGWETRPVSDGYAGLRDLADEGFSGAVSAGSAWLFMVSGRVVGVFEYRRTTTEDTVEPADVDRFEGAELTAYAAPEPSVPLLVAMKARGGESRGKYYTEDTPLSEVQDTLESGGFTGYLELSENVLSGDYYTVYQAGSAADLAFVGNARRRYAGEDAAERARDEVGIYEVVAVDLDVVEVPEPEPDDEGATGTASAAGAAGAAGATDAADGSDAADEAAGEDAATETGSADVAGDAGAGDGSRGDAGAEPGDADATSGGDDAPRDPSDAGAADTDGVTAAGDDDGTEAGGDDATDARDDDATEAGDDAAPEAGADAPTEDGDDAPSDGGATGSVPESEPGRSETESGPGEPASGTDRTRDRASESDGTPEGDATTAGSAGGRDRTTGGRATGASGASSSRTGRSAGADGGPSVSGRPVPSVDPARSGAGGTAAAEPEAAPASRQQEPDPRGRQQPAEPSEPAEPQERESAGESPAARADATDAAEPAAEVEALRSELSERERELAEAREELESVTQERDDLAAEVERLRDEVNRLSAELGEDLDGPTLSPVEAFEGTNLFVRYRSKGDTTLADLHDGEGSLDELRDNLRIEHHTTFPAEGATVDGRPFGEWLRDTQAHRFVEWLVVELLPEIRDSGAVSGMQDLYDALPEVDRIEFRGAVAVETDEGSHAVDYDVVCRDRMGDPLVVVATDESREPVREGAMADLVTETGEMAQVADTVAGAFYVSSSFFEADALETAREAVSGSLLSRDRRRSFVKLSRKSGFHLCLVEAREGTFYLSVPDL